MVAHATALPGASLFKFGSDAHAKAAAGIVVIDPGHGMSNRTPGVFDPGIVGVNGAREADLALRYALCLEEKLGALNIGAMLTRRDNVAPCSLMSRTRMAREVNAVLLLSIHFNGDAEAGNSAADKKVKGCEALYKSRLFGADRSRTFAEAIVMAMSAHIRLRATGAVDRQNLAVLSYSPSVLLEVGFLDDPEDAALLLSDSWMHAAMTSLARAVAQTI